MTFHQPPPPPGHSPQGAGPFGLGTPTGPGQPAHSRRRWLKYGAVALVSLFVGVGIGAGSGSADTVEETGDSKAAPRPTVTITETAGAEAPEPAPTVTETVTETVTAKPKKTKKPGPATRFSGDGEYLVGEDMKAGTYKTAGPADEWGCYWERAKDASGEFEAIITNNNLTGQGRVTLNNGEYFKTNGCQEWKRVG
ncbi:hypothetical protein [Streptomyces capillispiralis]|uniref:Uncharacterized protein n=1 Tax=Streptomyces capillispiralis TaxID=68182 RepID=A0A561TA28_9ACTN|nr:hypothetical protein [Streptomyces capillispiralis]TWF83946.1 hypothetical protein FHX78_11879 [Streptomyces capillispiralis]GHH95060.1 hypothetical protein GCM10017779_55170 [Streptomyces capillispiralis]